jgi:hypothetical protein
MEMRILSRSEGRDGTLSLKHFSLFKYIVVIIWGCQTAISPIIPFEIVTISTQIIRSSFCAIWNLHHPFSSLESENRQIALSVVSQTSPALNARALSLPVPYFPF